MTKNQILDFIRKKLDDALKRKEEHGNNNNKHPGCDHMESRDMAKMFKGR